MKKALRAAQSLFCVRAYPKIAVMEKNGKTKEEKMAAALMVQPINICVQ